jgi:hypothetical protein
LAISFIISTPLASGTEIERESKTPRPMASRTAMPIMICIACLDARNAVVFSSAIPLASPDLLAAISSKILFCS